MFNFAECLESEMLGRSGVIESRIRVGIAVWRKREIRYLQTCEERRSLNLVPIFPLFPILALQN
jgi:hypothetical protein